MTLPDNTEYRKTRYESGESKLEQVVKVAILIDVTLLLILVSLAVCPIDPFEAKPSVDVLMTQIKDRPVLESVDAVRQARMTGVSEFDFNGEHYIVRDLPKGYVDYSSWYVRMP